MFSLGRKNNGCEGVGTVLLKFTCVRLYMFQILKGWKYDSAADWWSFGVLVYEMLIGQV